MTNKVVAFVIGLCFITCAQVNLTGTVSDSIYGFPIPGVVVTLEALKTSDTTDAQGKYKIIAASGIKYSSSDIISGSRLVGNHLKLNISEPSLVAVEVFNDAGKKITTLFNARNLPAGTYDINLSASGISTGLYLIKARLGNQRRIYQYLLMQTSHQNKLINNGGQKGAAKKSDTSPAIDTLVFSKAGYSTTMVSILSYNSTANAVLEAIAYTPVMLNVTLGDGSITVSWDSVTGAASYNLYYAIGTTVGITTGIRVSGVTSPKLVIGMTNGTQYAFAISAVNKAGESGLSNFVTATPQAKVSGSVFDIDGNGYDTVRIGTQVWMVENLRTTRLNDGTTIPLVTDQTTWWGLSTPGYCWYNNDEATYMNPYGALYNCYAVNTGKLAPTGWHVASESDWTTLTYYLGDSAGGKLKDTGTTYWKSPNTGATNESGFSALPGGYRLGEGLFSQLGNVSYWWASNSVDATTSYSHNVVWNNTNVNRNLYNNAYGISVRCVRNGN